MDHFFYYVIVGFFAQIIDGALGMAYGLITTTLLLSLGLSPLAASTTTHAAECITTGFSAFAHHQFGNINRRLILRLVIPGIIGAMIGAYVLVNIDGARIKPVMALYLMIMGIVIITKVFLQFPPVAVTKHLIPLGFFGGLIDVMGGGGWGPIVNSTLLARGSDGRTTIGSVNICEFFVVIAASLTFFLSGSYVGWKIVLGLALGGAFAAPLGAWLCKYLPSKYLLLAVGSLIILLSLRMIWTSL